MIKNFLIYTVAFAVLFGIIYFAQEFILNQWALEVRFSLYDTTLFFGFTSFMICLHLEIFSNMTFLQPQIGFIYLPTLFIKGILFYAMFKTKVFQLETFTDAERLNLLIPLLLFLTLEVFFVAQILNRKQPST